MVKELKNELKPTPRRDAAAEEAGQVLEVLRERIFREQVTEAKRRPDGRAFDEIREISIEVGVLPRTHGSALFTRGETQALVTTHSAPDDMQRIERSKAKPKALHAALQLPAVLGR